jgi:hypothetical protein
MLKVVPDLILLRTTVVDYSGRINENVSAFECALGACDLDMVKMIEPYFDNLTNTDGDQEKAEQFHKQFPEGIEAEPLYDFNTLAAVILNSDDVDIIAELKHEASKSNVSLALEAFRSNFSRRNITSGEIFNLQNLIRALDVYDLSIVRQTTSKFQRDLYWRQVVGYVQRYLSAYDAQVICSTKSYDYPTCKMPVIRCLDHTKGHLYPLPENNERSGVGFEGALLSERFLESYGWTNLEQRIIMHGITCYANEKEMELAKIHRRLASIKMLTSRPSKCD